MRYLRMWHRTWLVLDGQKVKISKRMEILRRNRRLLSAGIASAVLLATTGMTAPINIDPTVEVPEQVDEIYFSEEECESCKYITIYDENSNLLYDGLIQDRNDIKDEVLSRLLGDSDYIMSNEITDYYILSK